MAAKDSWSFNSKKGFTPLTLRSEYDILPRKTIYGDSGYTNYSDCNYCQGMDSVKQMAGLKIFALITLNSWRKRRKDLQHANGLLEELQQSSTRTKNQLQIYNQLLKTEQRRNDELNEEIKKSLKKVQRLSASYESLSSNMVSVKADKALLEQELKLKYEEYDDLHSVLSQTKTDLFRCMMDQRNLRLLLCKEKKIVQSLENQKNRLINEICEVSAETRRVEEKYTKILEEKEQQILESKNKVLVLKAELDDLKEKTCPMLNMATNNEQLRLEIEFLRSHIIKLKRENDASINNRAYLICQQLFNCNKNALRYLYMCFYYLLPATPPLTTSKCKHTPINI